MPTYLVLLRGVNVGKAKRVPMAELKQALLDLGCTRAVTLLNSGNAVVEHPEVAAPTLAATVAAALGQRFGFEVPVIVKTRAELDAAIAGNPLVVAEPDHSKLLVAFAQNAEVLAGLVSLSSQVSPPEQFHLGDQAAYFYFANGILESQVAEALLGKVGKQVTTRNWATVLKLKTLAAGGQ